MGSTRCGFLNWILQEERAQYLAKKPFFLFLTSDLIPYAEAPLQRFSTSMPETTLLWLKNQLAGWLAVEGLFIKSWFSIGFCHLPMKVWWSWWIPLFLSEDQWTDMRLTYLAYLWLYIFGFLSILRTRSAPSVEAPSPFLCLSLEKYKKLTVFLGFAGKWNALIIQLLGALLLTTDTPDPYRAVVFVVVRW